MKVAFYTLGCKVNQYDTQMMAEKLISAGFSVCDFSESPDVFIINTCTVTQVSDKKSRNVISKARRSNPDSIIVVCGCYSQVSPADAAAIEGVDIVIGTRNRPDIVYYVQEFLKNGKQIIDVEKVSDIQNENITGFSEKTRAIIKIEDGCRNFCSYCLIPFARGKIVSKPISQIVSEATELAKSGYKEVVLTGIHLSSYGSDLDGANLSDAIDAVSAIDGIKRIRLGSLEPRIVTEDFVNRIKNNQKFCPAFHLSLQSGCDTTLLAMNRKYTSAQYRSAVELIRQNIPDSAFTTDVIVGFPGETDEDFEKSLAFVSEIGFAKVHIFPYSKRKGTKAAAMKDQVQKLIKKQREEKLFAATEKSRKEFLDAYVGKTVEVLAESCTGNTYTGFTKNYISVKFDSDRALTNTLVNVTVTDCDGEHLYGKLD